MEANNVSVDAHEVAQAARRFYLHPLFLLFVEREWRGGAGEGKEAGK